MATIIEQQPLSNPGTFDKVLPVGQEIIYTVSNSSVVSSFTKVKFIAEVHISNSTPPNPNNTGVGMFDFRPIIESFVNADNLAREGSAYKGTTNTSDSNVPMHLIDKYSGNINTMRWFSVKFMVEYVDASGNLVTNSEVIAGMCVIFNGYLKYTDELLLSGVNFGYDLYSHFLLDGSTKKFLTNAPTTQYANLEDYGTVGMLMPYVAEGIEIIYFDSSGGLLGQEQIDFTAANGGFVYPQADIQALSLYFGIFPANLQGSSTMFQGLVTAGTIQGG